MSVDSGAWDGFGIASSAAASDPNQLTALGVMLNDDGQGGDIYSIFAGLSVGPRDVLVKWTFYGDTDLNGVVDGDDLVSFNVGYLNNLSGWVNGDFDYSGVVDGDDLTVLLVSYNQTHGGPYTGQVLSDGGVRAVPEPGTLALAALGALGLALAARRRSK